jgi:hypothetical protein
MILLWNKFLCVGEGISTLTCYIFTVPRQKIKYTVSWGGATGDPSQTKDLKSDRLRR